MEIKRINDWYTREKVLELLNRAFTDTSLDYFPRRTFYDPSYKLSNTFILEEDYEIISTVQVFFYNMWDQGKVKPIAGIGNVATDPKFQGRGYGSKIMETVHSFLRDNTNVVSAMLFTGTPAFYQRLGYKLFTIKEYNVGVTDPVSDVTNVITFSPDLLNHVALIHETYNQHLVGPLSKKVEDYKSQFSYVLEDRSLFLLTIREEIPTGYIRARKDGNLANIIEFASVNPAQDFPTLCYAVKQKSGADQVLIGLSQYEAELLSEVVSLKEAGNRNIMFLPLNASFSPNAFDEKGNFWLSDVF